MAKITIFIFQTITLFSMIFLTNLRNPVHSVFLLILVFANVGAILLFLSIEFLALVYVIVYLGAIAVLFLFAVMMLNIKLSPVSDKKYYYAPLAIIVTLLLATELTYVLTETFSKTSYVEPTYIIFTNILATNLVAQLAVVLFLLTTIPFLMVGLILLVALIGAIILTISEESESRHQEISAQVKADSITVRTIGSGILETEFTNERKL
jgi:NADH-quinone oxidoreductase subunit J